jgi:hypothetical protein
MFTFPFTLFAESFSNKFSTSFNGVDETASVAYNANMATPSFSISFWSKFTNNNYNIMGVSSDVRIEVHSNSTTRVFLRGALPSGGNKEFHVPTGELDDNQWHHIVLTYNDATDTMELFIDGAVGNYNIVNNQAFPDGRRHGNSPFTFGDSLLVNPFIGNLDEITWFNIPLTLSEVQELYNSGEPTSPNTHSQVANLVSWWRMGDGDTNVSILDQINGNDATLINMNTTNYTADVP